jgi:serine/threonine protein kinase
VADIVIGLEDLQWKGVVHRDIKPSNIIVSQQGTSKLIGFGLSTILEEGKVAVADGMIVGTLDYMAPEVIVREPYDYQADIWSLGAVFYEALAGLPPFASLESERSLQIEQTQDNIRRSQPAFNLPGMSFSVGESYEG